MLERKYKVLVDGETIAEKMNINDAALLLKALFKEYYNDPEMVVAIREMDRCEGCCSDEVKKDG